MWNIARSTWGGVKVVASDLKVVGDYAWKNNMKIDYFAVTSKMPHHKRY